MRLYEVLVLLAFSCALTTAEYNEPRVYKQTNDNEAYEKPTRYKFGWESKDGYGNSYGHEEARDQDKTRGSYYVHLPDGRLQKVTYYVDGNSGFQATVTYEGGEKSSNSNYESTPIVPSAAYTEPLSRPNYHRPNYAAKPLNPPEPKEKSYIAKEVYPTSYKTNPYYESPAQPSYNGRISTGPKMANSAVPLKYPALGNKYAQTPKYSITQQIPAHSKLTESAYVPQKYADLGNNYAQTQKYSLPQQSFSRETQYNTQRPQYVQHSSPKSTTQGAKPSTHLPSVTLDSVYVENYAGAVVQADPEPMTYSKESSVEFRKNGEENRTPKLYASSKLIDKQSTYVPAYEPKPVFNDRELHSTIKPTPKKNSHLTRDPYSSTTSELTPRKKIHNPNASYTESTAGTPKSPATYHKNLKQQNGSYKSTESGS